MIIGSAELDVVNAYKLLIGSRLPRVIAASWDGSRPDARWPHRLSEDQRAAVSFCASAHVPLDHLADLVRGRRLPIAEEFGHQGQRRVGCALAAVSRSIAVRCASCDMPPTASTTNMAS
jgi:hypothetical protein